MSITYEMLLHPDLLTNAQLIFIIRERYLKIPDIDLMSRQALLEVFHNYCVPYAQRRPESGRGKSNKGTRKPSEKESNADDVSHHKRIAMKPPDLLAGHLKRIKLSHEFDKKTSLPLDVNKRKVTEMMEVTPECTPPKKERRLITWP